MATKDQLIARATATEADRNEVFLQSEALREETFNEWLATKDITVPDNETMVNIANELIEQRQDMAELKTHHHDDRYAWHLADRSAACSFDRPCIQTAHCVGIFYSVTGRTGKVHNFNIHVQEQKMDEYH